MRTDTILKNKKEAKEKIITDLKLPKKNKALGIVCLKNSKTLEKLVEGLKILPANFIIHSKEEYTLAKNIVFLEDIPKNIEGADFIIVCNNTVGLSQYFSAGVAPIVSVDNSFGSLLIEFNAVKNIGNAFLFNDCSNEWQIFYALSRYLENFKFSFDNKNLVKNVLSI